MKSKTGKPAKEKPFLGGFIGFRVSEQEKKALEEKARELNMSITELLRFVVRFIVDKNETLSNLEKVKRLLDLNLNLEEKKEKKEKKGLKFFFLSR